MENPLLTEFTIITERRKGNDLIQKNDNKTKEKKKRKKSMREIFFVKNKNKNKKNHSF